MLVVLFCLIFEVMLLEQRLKATSDFSFWHSAYCNVEYRFTLLPARAKTPRGGVFLAGPSFTPLHSVPLEVGSTVGGAA